MLLSRIGEASLGLSYSKLWVEQTRFAIYLTRVDNTIPMLGKGIQDLGQGRHCLV
jgi:hypothetical protein